MRAAHSREFSETCGAASAYEAEVKSVGSARFWVAFCFLNAVMNVRFPERSAWPLSFLPSLDVVALSLAFALCTAWQLRVPRSIHALLVTGFVGARVLRVADGVEQGAYLRNFNCSVDLPLLPEFVRLFYATLPLATFLLSCVGTVVVLVGLSFAIHRALCTLELAMSSLARVRMLCFPLGVLALASGFLPLSGGFGPSILWRVADELTFAWHLPSYRARQVARIAAVQRELASGPRDLQKLRGQNVLVFVVESYGQSVLDRPEIFARVAPEYGRFEADLAPRGFRIASRILDSSTYGGRSWLAQASLLTGVPTFDQYQYELLRAARPRSIAQVFAAAGYRTVLAQPGTVRESDQPDLLHFERHYFARDLGYAGPRFGWATMPDQFVLDAVHRRELAGARTRPLFVVEALVSSHVPWSDLPPVVEDWSRLGDGSSYRDLPSRTYVTHWLSLESASQAYADSIVYDLEVLRRYIATRVQGDSLLVIVGDHQPHSAVTGQGPARGVPVHVLSRNGAFIDPFRARGYTAGMLADPALPHPGLDTLLRDLIVDFSTDHVGSVH